MPESVQEYHARIAAAADDEGRFPVGDVADWDVFPFEREGLRLKPLEPLADSEAPRWGEGGRACEACTQADERNAPEAEVWRDRHWRVTVAEPTGSPVVLILQPLAHHDFTDLTDELAGEMGRIMVHLGAAVEALPSVARVHVSRWGDGGSHAHVFFLARPARMPQLRGTCLALWDDFLPPVPVEVRDANARAAVAGLVRAYGGSARGVAG